MSTEAASTATALAEHDQRTAALHDAVLAAERAGEHAEADKLRTRLARMLAEGTRMSGQLQALGTEAELCRRVQLAEQRQRSRARLDTYLATKDSE